MKIGLVLTVEPKRDGKNLVLTRLSLSCDSQAECNICPFYKSCHSLTLKHYPSLLGKRRSSGYRKNQK
ncbi:MAG: hypothetical protein QHH14_11325 [Clostridiales bacterium]|jgi:hypothetical protein|nr:hypothetical protein [Clostridiales bacterium]